MEVNIIGNTTQHDAMIQYLEKKLINSKADSTTLKIAQNYKPTGLIFI
jgi:hypothetical protein